MTDLPKAVVEEIERLAKDGWHCDYRTARDALESFARFAIAQSEKDMAPRNAVIAAAVRLVPLLEEGWDEYDTSEDQNEGAKACDALIAAVKALSLPESPK